MDNRTCLVLFIIIMVLALPSLAKPSAFEKDNSGKDLQDLESMLSGEHRGAQYAQNALPNPVGALYDPPYKNEFLNDTFFGDFLREFGADPSLYQLNLTRPKSLLIGLPYQNASIIAKPTGTNRHHIKPMLVVEPDF